MTARELLQFEMEVTGRQLEVVVDGLPDAGWDMKCSPVGMSPRETIIHLCEAYDAFCAVSWGEKYDWGSFDVADKSPDGLLKAFREMRGKAVQVALAKDDVETTKHGYDYIVGHDNYHIGLMVHSRLQVQPDWDIYALYG